MVAGSKLTLKDMISQGKFFVGGQVPPNVTEEQFAYVAEHSDRIVWTTLQHSASDYRDIDRDAEMARKYSVELIVRLEHPYSGNQATKVLDLGASGITVPQVDKPEQLLTAFRSSYYPSMGNSPNYGGQRSSGGAGRVGDPRGMDLGYFDWANHLVTIGAQIESIPAARNARILAEAHLITTKEQEPTLEINRHHEPGLTYLDFGPNDFRADAKHRLEYLPGSLNEEETEAAKRMTQRIPQHEWVPHMDLWIDQVVKDVRDLPVGVVMRDADRVPIDAWVKQYGEDTALGRLRDLRERVKEDYKNRGLNGVWFNQLLEKDHIPELKSSK